MFRIAFLTGIVALAAPALAQDVTDPSAGPSATPPHAVHEASPGPGASATPPAELAPAEAAASGTTPPQTGADPQAIPPAPPPSAARPATSAEVGVMVGTEFPARDRDGSGSLDRGEFTAWLGELVARSPSASPGEAGMQARIEGAFGTSDIDGDGSVSAAEMTALLSRSR